MRIGIAALVLCDLIIRASDLRAHYTSDGLWSADIAVKFGWNPGYWSLHTLNDSFLFQCCLFSVHFLFAVFLLLGFKTRLFTLLTWLMTISLHNRNLFILQGGDDLLRLILFWGIFLPWNSNYSLDLRRKDFHIKQNTLANIGYLLLLASVYFFAAILKNTPEWHSEGTAVYYALSLEQLRLPIGDWLYQFPGILKLFTWLVLLLEFAIPLLILLPSKKGRWRYIAFILLLLLHIGIGLSLYVGLFFIIGMVSALGLLPATALNKIENRFKHTDSSSAATQDRKYPLMRWIERTICVGVMILCLFVNLSTIRWFPYEPADTLKYPVNGLRLTQYWGMFSPGVLKKDGWFVYYGRDSIGRQWDLRRNEDYVDFKKPDHIVDMYKNDRWRKLAENMQSEKYTFLRPLYCKYMLKAWNRKHPERKMALLSVYFMEKENLENYRITETVKTLHCTCYND